MSNALVSSCWNVNRAAAAGVDPGIGDGQVLQARLRHCPGVGDEGVEGLLIGGLDGKGPAGVDVVEVGVPGDVGQPLLLPGASGGRESEDRGRDVAVPQHDVNLLDVPRTLEAAGRRPDPGGVDAGTRAEDLAVAALHVAGGAGTLREDDQDDVVQRQRLHRASLPPSNFYSAVDYQATRRAPRAAAHGGFPRPGRPAC